MLGSLLNFFAQSDIPLPIIPGPSHFSMNFLVWLARLMDEYRDIRMIWVVIDSILMVVIIFFIGYYFYRMRELESCLKEKYQKIEERLKKIKALHRKIDKSTKLEMELAEDGQLPNERL